MGKAGRWLRGLLSGGKKQPAVQGENAAPQPPKEKRRWGFARSFRDKDQLRADGAGAAPSVAAFSRKGEATSTRSYASSAASSHSAFLRPSRAPPAPALDEDEQNKRAIAVAAATAAVAEAAVAAAQAAAAVVRLTSSGRCVGLYGPSGRKAGELAAVRIQAAFRGYLARRALRALRGLVKLQALVRGHIVRKQAAQTLRCMHALVRVQARARACRALSEKCRRRTATRPPTPEKMEPSVCVNNSKRNTGGTPAIYNWLDRGMEGRYWDGRVVSSRIGGGAAEDERNDKILEVDTGKPHRKAAAKRKLKQHSSPTAASDQNSHSFATLQGSPSKDSTTAQLSVPSPSSVDMQHSLSPLRFAAGDLEHCDSPQFHSATSRPGSAARRGGGGPFTPTQSECSRSFFNGYADYPNYMANTESSRAKARSQSAPRQRPDYERLSVVNRVQALGGGGGGGGQSSSSSRSSSLHLKFTSKAYPGSGRLDRMGMPLEY